MNKLKKWLDKTNKSFKKYEGFYSLAVGLALMVSGLTLFWLGFHNFDTAQNLDFLQSLITRYQSENNLPVETLFHETTLSAKKVYDYRGLYTQGVIQSFKGFFLSLFGASLIGYGIRDYNRVLNENKNP